MQDDDQRHKDQFDAALPLPLDDSPKKSSSIAGDRVSQNPAADLIRRRVEEAYEHEPAPSAEAISAKAEAGSGQKVSKHQKFILELTNSGKPLHEIQMAWHEYYAGLPDAQKHEVWQEFYQAQSEASHYHAAFDKAETTKSTKKTSWEIEVANATEQARDHKRNPSAAVFARFI